MMDKMREEFEDWFCSTIPYQIAKSSWFAIMDDGDYIITDVQASWAGWKASRSALCVEFPKQPKKIFSFDDGAFQVVRQLESCGVDVKNKPCWAIKLLESCKNKPLT